MGGGAQKKGGVGELPPSIKLENVNSKLRNVNSKMIIQIVQIEKGKMIQYEQFV